MPALPLNTQRAMAVAMLYPNGHQGKKATSSEIDEVGASMTYVKMARTVLRDARELAEAVLSGADTLDRAYAVAAERKAWRRAPAR